MGGTRLESFCTSSVRPLTPRLASDHSSSDVSCAWKLLTCLIARASKVRRNRSSSFSSRRATENITSARFLAEKCPEISTKRPMSLSVMSCLGFTFSDASDQMNTATWFASKSLMMKLERVISLSTSPDSGMKPTWANDHKVRHTPDGLKSSSVYRSLAFPAIPPPPSLLALWAGAGLCAGICALCTPSPLDIAPAHVWQKTADSHHSFSPLLGIVLSAKHSFSPLFNLADRTLVSLELSRKSKREREERE
mmetsp:Transcript_43028/g.99901  ORF Transcript_43028/g.99901 Transcript_43028/m.99901 type:complete len:251 (+) Transcript_43028:819-1571(+)